ncbi:MAG: hypothetical protein V4801_10245 [Burkholderia gladioli]
MSYPTDHDDDWMQADPEYDEKHEPRRCQHGMPIHDCDWCAEERDE